MELQTKTLEKLRVLINEEIEYRSGPQLVQFFNNLGFHDSYGQGFPSRWIYTDEKLKVINGSSDLDKCIKQLFAPINFIGEFEKLDKLISEFNQYLTFDGWNIFRKGQEVSFSRVRDIDEKINSFSKRDQSEEEFLEKEFKNLSIEKLELDSFLTNILQERIKEIQQCLKAKSYLSVVFLSGSSLEGVLLGCAIKNPKEFNRCNSSPRDKEGKVKLFQDWTLSNFIDVARSLNLVGEDVKKFSHALRDFRNYIHPYEQLSSQFHPDEHTAKICWQVLQAAISQLSKTPNS